MDAEAIDTDRSRPAPTAGLDGGVRSVLTGFGVDAALVSGSVFNLYGLWGTVGINPQAVCNKKEAAAQE